MLSSSWAQHTTRYLALNFLLPFPQNFFYPSLITCILFLQQQQEGASEAVTENQRRRSTTPGNSRTHSQPVDIPISWLNISQCLCNRKGRSTNLSCIGFVDRWYFGRVIRSCKSVFWTFFVSYARTTRPNVSHFCGSKNSSIEAWGSQITSIEALENKIIVFRLKPNLNCNTVKQANLKMWNIWSGT